ncbi:hypothetical protein HML84_00470 [Alcanivorax sp. IO_7]|nr:hypothetical protein HML84_00470 [Alcanivorax sp. IO_7]
MDKGVKKRWKTAPTRSFRATARNAVNLTNPSHRELDARKAIFPPKRFSTDPVDKPVKKARKSGANGVKRPFPLFDVFDQKENPRKTMGYV